MPVKYGMASEPKVIAGKLIKDHHSQLGSTRIEFVFEEKINVKTGQAVPASKKGREVYAVVKVVTGLSAWLAAPQVGLGDDVGESGDEPYPFFVLLIYKASWDKMNKAQKTALVDQQLCKMDVDSKGNPITIEYDIQEFNEIAKRHGPWNEALERFLTATAQLKLDYVAGDKPEPAAAAVAAGNGKSEGEAAASPESGKGSSKKSRAKGASKGGLSLLPPK